MTRFREKEQREDYFACADITYSMAFLPAILEKWEKDLHSVLLITSTGGPRLLHLKNAIQEDLNDVPVYERSLHGVALGQAKIFTIYDMMKKSNAFLIDQAPYWFAYMQMDGKILKSISTRNPGKFILSVKDE